MRRKIKDSVIENLEYVCVNFTRISALISFIILICSLPNILCPPRDMDIGVTRDIAIIAFIWFLISLICFSFLTSAPHGCLEFLRNRNDKIDEEEKARQQALLLETEERNRANSQIWVI
jgi:hypothetical protein